MEDAKKEIENVFSPIELTDKSVTRCKKEKSRMTPRKVKDFDLNN